MAFGLLALLDDVAALAKAAAASVDDVAASATKASAKTVGVVIDDTAVTPQYVSGITPDREVPVVRRIALGSLRNKFLIVMPVALLLTWLAPQILPVFLLAGGLYLSYEGAEKVMGAFAHGDAVPAAAVVVNEDDVVASATRTDLVLSTEIMLIALGNISEPSFSHRIAVLALVALVMTVLVYGTVAVLIKLDDFGMMLRDRDGEGVDAALGRWILVATPKLFSIINVVGTAAMLWVGGHLLISSADDLGLHWMEHVLEALTPHVSSFIDWAAGAAVSGVFGLAVGAVVVGCIHVGASLGLSNRS